MAFFILPSDKTATPFDLISIIKSARLLTIALWFQTLTPVVPIAAQVDGAKVEPKYLHFAG